MGFGFNLLIVFVLFPLSLILILIWIFYRKIIFGKLLLFIWLPVVGLLILSLTINFFTAKKKLEINDIYGNYMIDRKMFKGKQTDWQYNHFRLAITDKKRFNFFVTDKDKIIKTYVGAVSFVDGYPSPRIVFHSDTPRHHIIEKEPTLYRAPFSFYYVFYSPKFGNVFFIKGKWKPIED